jgi:hypothetical protein
MENIFEADQNFDFSKLSLGTPFNVLKGTFFTKLFYNNKPFFIQTPKSLTKQGIVKNKKKSSCDLMFTNNDDIFINWVENLESKCHQLLYEKGTNWFENKMELSDIESTFQSPLKLFKSGKFYLMKTNVKNGIKIYNENNTVISQDEITTENTIISIVEVQGIEFSTRNFQIEFEMKQTMLVSPDPFLDSCFIKIAKQIQTHTSLPNSTPLAQIHVPIIPSILTVPPIIKIKEEEEPDILAEDLIQNFELNKSNIIKEVVEIKDEIVSIETVNDNKKPKIRFTEDTLDNSTSSSSSSSSSLYSTDNNDDDELIILDEECDINDFEIEDLDLDLGIDVGEKSSNKIVLKTRATIAIEKEELEKEHDKKEKYKKYMDIIEKSNNLRKETIQVYLEAQELMKKYKFDIITTDTDNEKIIQSLDYIVSSENK